MTVDTVQNGILFVNPLINTMKFDIIKTIIILDKEVARK